MKIGTDTIFYMENPQWIREKIASTKNFTIKWNKLQHLSLNTKRE